MKKLGDDTMKEKMKEYLLSLNVIVDARSIEELSEKDTSEINAFHAEKVYMIEEDDELFLGMRANHFVVEEGYSEYHRGAAYLISANHKGIRLQTLLIDGE